MTAAMLDVYRKQNPTQHSTLARVVPFTHVTIFINMPTLWVENTKKNANPQRNAVGALVLLKYKFNVL